MKKQHGISRAALGVCWALFGSAPPPVTASEDPLYDGFVTPSIASRPTVLWHWLNGYVKEADVARELEAMAGQGIGSATVLDVGPNYLYLDRTSPPGLKFGSTAWNAVLLHSLRAADRLGMKLSVGLCSGWAMGGDMVSLEDSLKYYIWSERVIDGDAQAGSVHAMPEAPEPFETKLLQPGYRSSSFDGSKASYTDVALLAFPYAPRVSAEFRPEMLNRAVALGRAFAREGSSGAKAVAGVALGDIVDLTARASPEGRVEWKIPPGKWILLRFGYFSGTMHTKRPSETGAGGPVIDVLSKKAMKRFFDAVAMPIVERARQENLRSLQGFWEDSWEHGNVGWTPGFAAHFQGETGYSVTKYLPVLCGYAVDNMERSSRFLRDYERVLAAMWNENHHRYFSELCGRFGLTAQIEMTIGIGAATDVLRTMSEIEAPMGEFWMIPNSPNGGNVKVVSSGAHIYGKNTVAAEAFTHLGPHHAWSPFDLKPHGDYALTLGLNGFVLHSFAHSPRDLGYPGNVFHAGTHFGTGITWWEQSHAFFEYLARCQYMLRQGKFVADVCKYIGDGPFFSVIRRGMGDTVVCTEDQRQVATLLGYGYDFCNEHALVTRMTVAEGKIVLPGGMSYEVLVLPERQTMSLEAGRKIAALVEAGATVIGPKPRQESGLRGFPESDQEVRELADAVWGEAGTVKRYGKGRVFNRMSEEEILKALRGLGIKTDFTGGDLHYIHRQTADADFFFVANLSDAWVTEECGFRLAGRVPELWDPVTARRALPVHWKQEADRVVMPLRLPPRGSRFVVFRDGGKSGSVAVARDGTRLSGQGGRDGFADVELALEKGRRVADLFENGRYEITPAPGKPIQVQVTALPAPLELAPPWKVVFSEKWGGPGTVQFEQLISWPEHPDKGIKYFSGTVSYFKTFDLPATMTDKRLYLDLGRVKELAEIVVNGRNLGVVWTAPFRLDITAAMRPGRNEVEVRVVNLWPNRFSGDILLPEGRRLMSTNFKQPVRQEMVFKGIKYKAGDEFLLESGLLGPVRIYAADRAEISW